MSFELYPSNLINQSTITASTVNALFPISNLKDYRRSKVYRSTTNADTVVIDFNETSEVDSFFIVSDKRAGFGISTITLEFNATNSWGAPAATETVTFSDIYGVGFKEFAVTHSYRFCRLVLTSTLGYCELSYIYLGKKMQIDRGISFGWTYKDDDLSQKKANRYGQLFSDIIMRQKTISGALRLLDKDKLEKFFAIYDLCGETKPFFIRLGCDLMIDDYRRFSGMVFFSDVPTITNTNFNKYNLTLTMREAT
jgi:hypothetical protein